MFDWVTGNVCCNLYGGGAPHIVADYHAPDPEGGGLPKLFLLMRRLLRRGGRSPICRALAFQVALALSDFVLRFVADVGGQCAVRSRSTLLGPPRSLAAKCPVSRPSCTGRLRVLDLDTLAARKISRTISASVSFTMSLRSRTS